jgi:hypothetical protein
MAECSCSKVLCGVFEQNSDREKDDNGSQQVVWPVEFAVHKQSRSTPPASSAVLQK